MELRHAWTCPCSQRVRIALAEKGLSVVLSRTTVAAMVGGRSVAA